MKIVYILIVVLLLFMTISFQNSQADSKESLIPVYQIPVTLYNSQNVSTPGPFQQMIKLNESNYKGIIIYNGSFANFEFTYENGTVIPAWIESNNSGILLIWVKLISIQALSFLTIYLDIFSSNDNLLNSSGKIGIGEAPQLSPIYGEYDDGANVFNFYSNFTNGLGNDIINNGESVTFDDNGIDLTTGTGGSNVASNSMANLIININYYGQNYIFQSAINYFQKDSDMYDMFGLYLMNTASSTAWQQNNTVLECAQLTSAVYQSMYNGVQNPQGTYTGYSGSVTWSMNETFILGMTVVGSNVTDTFNYNTIIPAKENYNPPTQYPAFGSWRFSNVHFYWVRILAYPPNGVMPYISFGSIIKIPIENAKINIHAQIYALNLSLPSSWGVYGYFNYSLYGKNYTINISNITDEYFIDLNISSKISIYNNTTLYYNLTLYAYKLQDYIALNLINFKGKLNITTAKSNYNLTLNSSAIKFENVNNFYYFWNAYGYKVIGSILIISLFLFFISRLRRVK